MPRGTICMPSTSQNMHSTLQCTILTKSHVAFGDMLIGHEVASSNVSLMHLWKMELPQNNGGPVAHQRSSLELWVFPNFVGATPLCNVRLSFAWTYRCLSHRISCLSRSKEEQARSPHTGRQRCPAHGAAQRLPGQCLACRRKHPASHTSVWRSSAGGQSQGCSHIHKLMSWSISKA